MRDRSRCRPSSIGAARVWLRAAAAVTLVVALGCGNGGAGTGGKGGGGAQGGAAGGGSGGAGAAGGAAGGGGTTGAAGSSGGAGGAAGATTAGAGGAAATAGSGGAGGTSGTGGGASGSSGAAGSGGAAGGGAGGTGGAQGAGGGGRGGAAGSGSAGAGGTGVSPAPAWDWVGVVGTGQSLAVGGHGNAPAMTIGDTTQRFRNLKLSLGSANVPPFDPANAALSMVPLTETLRAIATGYPSPYPRNIYGQSFHTAMGDQITTLVMKPPLSHDYVTTHTAVGEAGQNIAVIQKGAPDTGSTGRAYAASLFEVAAIARLAKKEGKSFGVGAIMLTHGESDAGSATFEADMVKLWQNYNQDLPPLTGQTAPIPMLLSQQHFAPTDAGSTSVGTLAQWRIGLDHPGEIICTGPKYQYAYVNDYTHLTNADYTRLGEKYGEVFYQRVVLGNDWQPLQPISVERSARVITVRFHVPAAPLAWDTTLPMPHQSAATEWAQGRGFEVRSGTTRIGIASVAIAGDAVQITCATDPPATGVAVGYAWTADGTQRPNGTTRWGQLRDSDPFVGSLSAKVQPNYAVAFEMNVP